MSTWDCILKIDRIKLCYLSAYNTPEAGNRVLLAWIKWQLNHGYDVALAYPGGGWMHEIVQNYRNLSIINCNFQYSSSMELPKLILTIVRLVQFIKTNKIQLVHCNSEVAYRYGMYAARICRIPIVTHFRFHFPGEFYKWSFGRKRSPAGVFFVSAAFHEEELHKLSAVAPTARHWILYNCIDSKSYIDNYKNTNQRKCPITIVYPAAIQEIKNQLHLFEIDKLLQSRGIDAEFISAGRVKEPDYWLKCQEKVREYSSNRVQFIGHVDDVNSLYKQAHLSLSLSNYETFGFSVLESMSCGVPVVSYAVPALKEVIGNSGVTLPIGDITAVADAITMLANNPNLRARMSGDARKRAQQNFSPDVILPQLLNCYSEIMI